MIRICIAALCALAGTMSSAHAAIPDFNFDTDLLVAQFDGRSDADDVHSQAALGCMMLHEDLAGLNVYGVMNAYGEQTTALIWDSTSLMNMVFGTGNANWTNAHADWDASVQRVANKVEDVLNAGGRVFVQEAGQSNITRDWLRELKRNRGFSGAFLRGHVFVVQHSVWNEQQTAGSDLTYVKNNSTYQKIDDGNHDDKPESDDTPDYHTNPTTSQLTAHAALYSEALSGSNANAATRALWQEARDIIGTSWKAGYSSINRNPSPGGLDFSDCVENWYIFGIGNQANTLEKFWSRYVLTGGDEGPAHPEAILTLSTTSVNVGQSVTFSAVGSIASGGETLNQIRFYYDWDAKDYTNVSSPTDTYSHTYSTPGMYDVYLRVRDSAGLFGWSVKQTIEVTAETTGGPDPVAAFTLSSTEVTVGEVVTISAADSVPSAGASNEAFLFRFNNGVDNTDSEWVSAPDVETTHVYTSPGTYDVRVFMRDSAGLKDWSDSQTITVTSGDGGSGGPATLLADTYVHKNKPTENFDNKDLRVSQNSTWLSYLEYDISAFSGTNNGLLSLYCTNNGDGQIEVFYNNASPWNESTMTYDSRIGHDTANKLGEISGTYTAGTYVDIPLNNIPLGTSSITLILEQQSAGDSTLFDSKDSTGNADRIPALEILPSGGG